VGSCTGSPEDYAAVHAIQDQYKLMPLSAYGRSYTPPPSGRMTKVTILFLLFSLSKKSKIMKEKRSGCSRHLVPAVMW
jgi:hypothetical protein